MSMRKALKKDGIKVSVNDFIIKAAAVALKVWLRHINLLLKIKGGEEGPEIPNAVKTIIFLWIP